MKVDCAIVGGGIVGLSVGMTLSQRQPGLRILVLEKEQELATHQTGRNSGVIHSGIYYPPGSLKARFSREGNRALIAFCRQHAIQHEICGKVIVATRKEELGELEQLSHRGLENGVTVERLSADEVRELEPHVACHRGLRVPSTAIVNFAEVARKYADLLEENGGTVRKGTDVRQIRTFNDTYILQTTGGDFETRYLVNCAGLQSDRVARRARISPPARILPFRGEYYELVPEKRHLVKNLIYPVPNPAFPFLGVHFTRMIDGSVHAGPNAVLALKREGYSKTDLSLTDLAEIVTYKGLWKLARKHYREGLHEMHRSFSKRAFVASLQRLIPEISSRDLVPAKSGVRAQALLPNGTLVNDFLLIHGTKSIHVCNAPSPAATASLEIAKEIVAQIPLLRTNSVVSLSSVS
ncbi:MAG TPA: L-2-hydroxyglutarate oxidase [Chthoniobacterales bacterium]